MLSVIYLGLFIGDQITKTFPTLVLILGPFVSRRSAHKFEISGLVVLANNLQRIRASLITISFEITSSRLYFSDIASKKLNDDQQNS